MIGPAPRNRLFDAFVAPARTPAIGVATPIIIVLLMLHGTHVIGGYALDQIATAATGPYRVQDALVEHGWTAIIAAEMALLLLVVAIVHKRSPWSLFNPGGRPFWAALIVAMALYAVFWGSETLIWLALGGGEHMRAQPWIEQAWLLMPAGVVVIALQSTAEEVMFRGYLIQQIAARVSSPLAWAVAPSVVFGFLHDDPTASAEQRFALVASATIFGLTLAHATWRTGSLGFAIGVHVANNWWAYLLLGAANEPWSALAMYVAPFQATITMVLYDLIFALAVLMALEIPTSPIRKLLALPPIDFDA